VEAAGRSICYLCDHEPFSEEIWRAGAAPGKIESILDAGDRRHAEYMQGADVVIHEAQYTPSEYPSKRHWGHSTYVYVVNLAVLAGVGRLFLTHHDPSHDDQFIAGLEKEAQELARTLNSKLEVSCAYEGCEISV
jgi:ribonuclease BN (tRNA processing enzyme)